MVLSTLSGTSPNPASLSKRATREFERLRSRAVTRSGLLDTGSEERFDRLTREACRRFDMPLSTLTLIAGERQYIKSMVGQFDREGPREAAFCNVTIQSEEGFVMPDALDHPLFSTSNFVIGPPHIRFYAGVPLRGPGGWFVGSLCVMDTKPRPFTTANLSALRHLAERAELELNSAAVGQVPQYVV